MILTILMFVVALCLSGVAAFYSIVGLTAIFAAAVTPIILMGSILEVAKLTVTVWLHDYWHRIRWLMKVYLCSAVVVLMIITSMGIFGFLSKAHSDQGMVSGDVLAKISVYDEKIKISKENIDANRRALKQMDEAVDQVMGRSTDEKGADKAVQIRRTQQKERARLLAEIEAEQKKITALNEERAPIAAEVRKVEAEVGPIKYIAALIYGDDPDANLLERAVRWVIILLVVVFDPLAVMMLLAATESRKWLREDKLKYPPDDGPLTEEQIEQIKESAKEDLPTSELVTKDELFPVDPSPPGWMYNTTTTTYPSTEEEVEELTQEFDRSKHAYLDKPFVHFENLTPMVAKKQPEITAEEVSIAVSTPEKDEDEDGDNDSDVVKMAKTLWKQANPTSTLKDQRRLLQFKAIDHLPWYDYIEQAENEVIIPFGDRLPDTGEKASKKGNQYIHTGYLPTKLFKYNGSKWIEVDKNLTDRYAYNDAYIDFLIKKVGTGEYDPELLNDSERTQLELKLKREII